MYNHQDIEKKWQDFWAENKTFKTYNKTDKEKYYVLDMFPYPSGAGLHVGHPEWYTANDIVARYKHAKGYNVLHTMGWDAFGLPAENYAIKTGTHPRVTTDKNIATFKRQIQSLGFSYDWDREIDTTDPKYFQWTQWIFLKLFEKWLAYEQDLPINYCPSCKTGLANEEVLKDFSCERCGTIVEKKKIRQWVLGITQYAERLLADVDDLDWPEGIKDMQRNWIGKSEGCEFELKKYNPPSSVDNSVPLNKGEWAKRKGDCSIRVYTTRVDTVFGMTYCVIAPDHPHVEDFITDEYKTDCEAYIKKSGQQSDQDRTAIDKEKTGVFTGSYVINPYNGEKVPLWIADYVLWAYGTGAVMAVPAHDERDFEFAKKYKLPIRESVRSTYFGSCSKDWKQKYASEIPELGDMTEDEIVELIVKQVQASERPYTGTGQLVDSGDHNWLTTPEAKEKLIASAQEKWFGHKTTNYKLRDWLFSRQRYWGEPIPLIHLSSEDVASLSTTPSDNAWVKDWDTLMIGEKEFSKLYDGIYGKIVCDYNLPLELPEVEAYEPAGDGTSPLTKVDSFVNVELADNLSWKRETNTMPQWGWSCWYYLRFMDPENPNELVAPEVEKYWTNVDSYVWGAEHAVLHLLYARFWHKFLYDIWVVSTTEPFYRLRNQGMILGMSYRNTQWKLIANDMVEEKDWKYFDTETGEELEKVPAKMSKSLKNVINPDDIVQEYWADTLRLYEMYMADFAASAPWDTSSIVGSRRFLDKVWKIYWPEPRYAKSDDEAIKTLHKTIKKVGEDIEAYKFNTAIAQMMICVNTGLPQDATKQSEWKQSFLKILHPFAPHMTEELWEKESFGSSKNYTKIYLASGNKNKLTRLQKVFTALDNGVQIDQVPNPVDVVEDGETSLENAIQKLEPYKERDNKYPVLSCDSSVFFPGMDFDPTHVRRISLDAAGVREEDLEQPEIAEIMMNFYKDIAHKAGGKLEFYYIDSWALLMPDRTIKTHEYKRCYTLTDEEKGERDIYFPMRWLYISKKTGKYAYETTDDDFFVEFSDQIDAMRDLFSYGSESIFFADWPTYDENLIKDDTVKIWVQVLGKLRGDIEIAVDEPKDSVLEKAKSHPDVMKWLEWKEIVKEIYVPGRIVNLVVK